MKRLIFVLPMFVVLPGCQNLTCKLLGLFKGSFGGSLSGDVEIEVTDNPDGENMADAEIRLSMPPVGVEGDTSIECKGGMFMTQLDRVDEDMPITGFGDFTGLLNDAGGDGEWSFFEDLTGNGENESGTWTLTRMD